MITSKIATPAVLAAFERARLVKSLPTTNTTCFSFRRLASFKVTYFTAISSPDTEEVSRSPKIATSLEEEKPTQLAPVLLPTAPFTYRKSRARFDSNGTTIGSVIRNQRMLNDFEWLGTTIQATPTPKPAQLPMSLTLPLLAPVQLVDVSDEEQELLANQVFFGNNIHEGEGRHGKDSTSKDKAYSGEESDESSVWLGAKTPSTGGEVASKTDGLNDALADKGSWLGRSKTPGSESDKAASNVDKFAYLGHCLKDASPIAEADDNQSEPFPQYEKCSCSLCKPEDSGYISDSTTENAKIFARLAALTERHQLQRECLKIPAGDLAPGYTYEDIAREYRNGRFMASNTIFAQGKIRAFFLENGDCLKRKSEQVVQKGARLMKPLVDLPADTATLTEAISETPSKKRDSTETTITPKPPPKTNPSQIHAERFVYASEEERLEDIAWERVESARQRAKERVPLLSWSSDGVSAISEDLFELQKDPFGPLPGPRSEEVAMRARKGAFRALLNENPDIEACIQRDLRVKVEVRNKYNKSPVKGEGRVRAPDSFPDFCRKREAKLAVMRAKVAESLELARTVEAPRQTGGKRSRFEGIFQQMRISEAGENVSGRLAMNEIASAELGIFMRV